MKNKKMLITILSVVLISATIFAYNKMKSTDTRIENHKLEGQTFVLSENLFVIGNIERWHTSSNLIKEKNSSIISLEEVEWVSYLTTNCHVKKVLKKGKTLTVKEVYKNNPNWLSSFFVGGIKFAILVDSSGEEFVMPITVGGELFWRINDLNKKEIQMSNHLDDFEGEKTFKLSFSDQEDRDIFFKRISKVVHSRKIKKEINTLSSINISEYSNILLYGAKYFVEIK